MSVVGHIDEATIYSVSGWLADVDNLSSPLEAVVYVDGDDVGRIVSDIYRVGLEEIAPGATGNYAFKYYFSEPLSPFRSYEILVRAAPSGDEIEPGVLYVAKIADHVTADFQQPLRGIILTTMGRSGSTMLMNLFACHPNIVVADERPFETELLTYYAYALRHLIAPGDHERSLRPDRITATENPFLLGWNPYFDASYRLRFNNPNLFTRLLSSSVPQRLATAFREIIVDFYNAVARDRGKSVPIYFAEKALPEDLIRRSARYMFPGVREVILVRDLRDAVVSFMKFGNMDFDLAFESLAASADQIVRIQESSGDEVCFVKYEDLVRDPEHAFHRILSFLGLTADVTFPDHDQLFKLHATSANPEASIGRWKRDLSAEALAQCGRFAEFQKMFGYEHVEDPEQLDL